MYLILLGLPGAGKGTQAKIIAERTGLPHVASGDLFRAAAQQGTNLGKRAKEYMDRGDLVPDELTITMLEERLRQPDARGGVVFDGFPRTLRQAQALDDAVARQGGAIDAALHITASDEELVRRLTQRWLCSGCGEIYHQEQRPPKQAGVCDRCGARLAQRDDDKPEVVRARLQKQRPPEEMLAAYRERGTLIEIDGQRSVDEVSRDLLAAIEPIAARAKAG